MIWLVWGLILILQNVSFTLVSRARNSASLARHVRAALLSNGVWFISQLIMVNEIFSMMKGDNGLVIAIMSVVYYTAATVGGSVLAHWWSLKTESGKSAVGASKKYAQITAEEWNEVKKAIASSRPNTSN